MAKILTLNNGTSYEFSDESTIYNMVGVYNTFAQVDLIRTGITTETLKGATFDGMPVEGIIVLNVTAEADVAGNVIFHVLTRGKSNEEVLTSKIMDLEKGLAELAEEIIGG